jgi:hypothetical protein
MISNTSHATASSQTWNKKKASETEGKVAMPPTSSHPGVKKVKNTLIMLLGNTKGQKIGKAYKRSASNLFKACKKAQRTRKPHLTKSRKRAVAEILTIPAQ